MQAKFLAVQWMTDFADQSVVMPVSCVMLLFFGLARWKRGVVVWFATIVGTLSVMLLLKLGIGACGWELGLRRLNSPSGHTASATVLYGSLLSVLFPRVSMRATMIAAGLIALAFAISRLFLHDHTVPEVLIGAAVGFCAVFSFRFLVGPVPDALRLFWMMAAILMVMVVTHGHRLPAEQQVHSFAITELRARLCPSH